MKLLSFLLRLTSLSVIVALILFIVYPNGVVRMTSGILVVALMPLFFHLRWKLNKVPDEGDQHWDM